MAVQFAVKAKNILGEEVYVEQSGIKIFPDLKTAQAVVLAVKDTELYTSAKIFRRATTPWKLDETMYFSPEEEIEGGAK
jgi:hypothetical protein